VLFITKKALHPEDERFLNTLFAGFQEMSLISSATRLSRILDPWLCVTRFLWLCLYRRFYRSATESICFIM